MLNYSTRFKELIKSDVRNVLYELNITLVDGTQITIDNSTLWGDSLTLEDGTSDNDKFTIGAAISTKLTFGINNIYGDFNGLSFDRADVILKIGMMVDETKEMVQVGKFIVDNADYDSSIISITALDNFIKMDSLVSVISFPTTTQTLVQNICSSCGITNMADDFLRDHNFDIKEFDYSNMTYRALLVYLCQYMGCFAKMDSQGRLVLKWYQDIFDDEEHSGIETIDTFSSLKLSTDFIEISGVEVVLDDEHSYSLGTSNYVVVVSNNPIIVDEEMAQALVNRLYVQIGGYKFKKCNADTLLYLWFESGDVVYIQENGTKYPIFISNRTLSSNGSLSFSCDAETPLRNNAVSNDTSASAIRQLRQDLKKEKDDRTRVEEELRQEIAGAGGVYETEVEGAEGEGGKIKYLHNKPLLADSAIQWKFTATTISVSNDYGQTWSFALNSNGQAILNQIYALGINADYVNTGYIKGLNEFKVEVYQSDKVYNKQIVTYEDFIIVNIRRINDNLLVAQQLMKDENGEYFIKPGYSYAVRSNDGINWHRVTEKNDVYVVGGIADHIFVGTRVSTSAGNIRNTYCYDLNLNETQIITSNCPVGKLLLNNNDEWLNYDETYFIPISSSGYSGYIWTRDFINFYDCVRADLPTRNVWFGIGHEIYYDEKSKNYIGIGQYKVYVSSDLNIWYEKQNLPEMGFLVEVPGDIVFANDKVLLVTNVNIYEYEDFSINSPILSTKPITEIGISPSNYDVVQVYKLAEDFYFLYFSSGVYWIDLDFTYAHFITSDAIFENYFIFDNDIYYFNGIVSELRKLNISKTGNSQLFINLGSFPTSYTKDRCIFIDKEIKPVISVYTTTYVSSVGTKYLPVEYDIWLGEEQYSGLSNSLLLSRPLDGISKFELINYNYQTGSELNSVKAANTIGKDDNNYESKIKVHNNRNNGSFANDVELSSQGFAAYREEIITLNNADRNLISCDYYATYDGKSDNAQILLKNSTIQNYIANQINMSTNKFALDESSESETNAFSLSNFDLGGNLKNKLNIYFTDNYGSKSSNIELSNYKPHNDYLANEISFYSNEDNNQLKLSNKNNNNLDKNIITCRYVENSPTLASESAILLENKQLNYDMLANNIYLQAGSSTNSISIKNYPLGSEDNSKGNSFEMYYSSGVSHTDLKNRRNYLEMYDDGSNECSVKLHNGQGSYLNLATNNNAELYAWNSVIMHSLNYFVQLHPYSSRTPAKFWFSNDGHIYFCQYESQVGNSLYRVA